MLYSLYKKIDRIKNKLIEKSTIKTIQGTNQYDDKSSFTPPISKIPTGQIISKHSTPSPEYHKKPNFNVSSILNIPSLSPIIFPSTKTLSPSHEIYPELKYEKNRPQKFVANQL